VRPWTSRRPSPSSSRAYSRTPWRTVVWAGLGPAIALPLVGMEPRATRGDVLCDQRRAAPPIGLVTNPEVLLTRVPRDDTDQRWPVVGVGPVPLALLGTPPGRISGITMGRTVFPRRFGTVRPPQRWCRSSPRSARSRCGWPGGAAAGYAAVCGTALTRGPGEPWARPSPCHATTARRWLVVGGFLRRPSTSTGYSSPRRPDSSRPENGPERGRTAAPCFRSAGKSIIRPSYHNRHGSCP